MPANVYKGKTKIQYQREWTAKKKLEDPLWFKGHQLKAAHGIGRKEYEEMLSNANGVCEICHLPETKTYKKTGIPTLLSVDHNHESGKIRGLLCSNCNLALGYLQEDIKIAKNLIAYIEKHGDK
jgi:hypothetical protein